MRWLRFQVKSILSPETNTLLLVVGRFPQRMLAQTHMGGVTPTREALRY